MPILQSASGPAVLRTLMVSATPREPTGRATRTLAPSALAAALAVMLVSTCMWCVAGTSRNPCYD